jgi:predicted kinase
MIHGFLGSGKTTFARHLETSLPALRFTHDEWMSRLYGSNPPADQFPAFFERVSAQIGDLWPRCVRLGVDVVLDLNFWSRAQRNEVRDLAAEIGADVRLHAFVCSDAVAWQRIEKRNQKLNESLFIDRASFDLLKLRFEPPGEDESAILHLGPAES